SALVVATENPSAPGRGPKAAWAEGAKMKIKSTARAPHRTPRSAVLCALSSKRGEVIPDPRAGVRRPSTGASGPVGLLAVAVVGLFRVLRLRLFAFEADRRVARALDYRGGRGHFFGGRRRHLAFVAFAFRRPGGRSKGKGGHDGADEERPSPFAHSSAPGATA